MNKLCFVLTLVISLLFWSCGSKKQDYKKILIENVTIKMRPYDNLVQKKVDGYIVGSDFKRKLVFIWELLPENRNHIIRLVDITNGNLVQRVPLKAGNFQSPDEFSEPTYIQYLGDNYYVFDHNYKIVVFDKKFQRLYSSMMHGSRYFIDFYNEAEKIFFLFGHSKLNRKNDQTCKVQLYQLERVKRPVQVAELFKTTHPTAWALHTKKIYYVGYFWANSWGFEKDGKIYYSDNRENNYYCYDRKTGETKVFVLSYLKGMRFSESDAQKFGNYKEPLWPKKMRHKVVYIAGKDLLYHFGLLDVGEKKIGLIADIDIDKLTFRLDVLDSISGQYLWSINLPFGNLFMRIISTSDGFTRHQINVDEGYYIWADLDEENRESYVLINRFKIRE